MDEAPRRGSLLVVFLTVFIDLLGFGIVIPLLPVYADGFGATAPQLGLLMASFSAMQFLFAPVWGSLSDRIGRRPVIMFGLAGSIVFYTLFGLATVWQSLGLLFVARVGAGVCGATISTAQAYIADTTTLANRPRGMALIGMAFGLGFTLGPLVGFLAVWAGGGDPGPLPGYLAAGLSAVALGCAWALLPESRRRGAPPAARRWLDASAWLAVLSTRSILMLLATSFICISSFSMLESTLSLLLKGQTAAAFQVSFERLFLVYAYIGLILSLVQGFIVRRLAGRVPEARLAMIGISMEISGFSLMILAITRSSLGWLFVALTLLVAGFGMLSPSLQSLLSRRSDPKKQGKILGVAQSVSSMGRIVGSGMGIPLLKTGLRLPYLLSAVLMLLGMAMVWWAARSGGDFEET